MSDKERRVEDGMKAKGYRYKLTPIDGSFDPLYAKTMGSALEVMRQIYPNQHFDVRDICKSS